MWTDLKSPPASAAIRSGLFSLSPTQGEVFESAIRTLEAAPAVSIHVQDRVGAGVSTILQAMREKLGGEVVDMRALFERTRIRHPRRFETVLFELIMEAGAAADFVFIDAPSVGGAYDWYARYDLAAVVSRATTALLARENKKVVLGGQTVREAIRVGIPAFDASDYRHIVTQRVSAPSLDSVSFDRVFQFARHLNAHQLARLADRLNSSTATHFNTADVLELVASLLPGNVNTAEVEEISFSQLVGADEIVQRLDRAILLPLQDPTLARELGVEPKHGILLHGPPGMGKTTVGRALAHMMQGKFFLIDGDYNHEQRGCFYKMVDGVFEAARQASPAVIFIDDADVVLSDPSMQHWGRYLLTKLDGLKSDTSGEVCVMMTAMDLGAMPPALLRSGRLEVWLTLSAPTADTRAAMIRMNLAKLPFQVPSFDMEPIVSLTDGFSPADLRRLVGDALGYIGYDRFKGLPERPLSDCLSSAAAALVRQKAHASQALGSRYA